jgi:DNA-directed RNA polymerase specialized sigma24 family protein
MTTMNHKFAAENEDARGRGHFSVEWHAGGGEARQGLLDSEAEPFGVPPVPMLDETEFRHPFETAYSAPAPEPEDLQTVLLRYLPSLHEYLVKRYRISEDQAADWVQSFVLEKILRQNLIAKADGRRSLLRTFLLRCLDHFVIQEMRRQHGSKRFPAEGLVHLDALSEADLPVVLERPEAASDVAWARHLLIKSLRRMEKHCADVQRPDLWGVFESRILKPLRDQHDPLPYGHLAKRYKLGSAKQAAQLLITTKRIFDRCLRAVIAEYVKDQQEVESEIEELKAILCCGVNSAS